MTRVPKTPRGLWRPVLPCCILILVGGSPAQAQRALACGPFTAEPVAAPAPRQALWPLRRFELIKQRVVSQPHRVLFLGDSLVERFETDAPEIWQRHMTARGVLNAGVSGDRTEHLLWRLQHGNLAGPPPAAAIVLIGTNDLTIGGDTGRPPELVAEGIRADLLYLRQHLPNTRLVLLGLLPRASSADRPLRRGTVEVNRLIQHCGDNRSVVYADLGGVLLDGEGRLSREVSPDLLHFSREGYQRFIPRLDRLIDRAVAAR